jgi:hypothetical protein
MRPTGRVNELVPPTLVPFSSPDVRAPNQHLPLLDTSDQLRIRQYLPLELRIVLVLVTNQNHHPDLALSFQGG